MFERNSKSAARDAKLSAAARHEAQRNTPAFSDALHKKIIRAVEAVQCEGQATAIARRAPALSWRGGWIVGPGLAAALTLMVCPLPSLLYLSSASNLQPAALAPMVKSGGDVSDKPVLAINQAAHDVNDRMKEVFQTAMVTPQWAGLDHDVRLATQYFVDQVPLRSAWDGDESPR